MEKEGMKMNEKMDGKMSGTLLLDKKIFLEVKSSDNLGNLNMEIEADMNGTKMPMESKIDMVYKRPTKQLQKIIL